jgi:uncharacterized protein YidB (DUF937 family)
MGLLDNVMGKLGGKQGADGGQGSQGGEGGLQALTKLLSANGGVQGLMAKLSSNGLGQQVQSWVGTGDNKPVSGPQVAQALDTDSLNKMAQETGTTPEKVSEKVAQVLPQVVDKATPGGQVPKQGDDPLSKGLDALKGMFANR